MSGKLGCPMGDRLGDYVFADCAAFRVPFRLVAETDLLLERMLAVVPMGSKLEPMRGDAIRAFVLRRGEDGTGYRLVCDESSFAMEGAEIDSVLEQLRREMMTYVADCAPDRVFVHAGVVAKDGRALLLPGKSFAGKTTLVAALVRAGAVYYSDEYAVLDEDGFVHSFPRELQMRRPGGTEQVGIAVETLNGKAGCTPAAGTRIVFAEYAEYAEWLPEPVTAGMAALEMLRHTIPVQRAPARVMATFAKVMESATAWRSARSEAGPVADVLLAMLDDARAS